MLKEKLNINVNPDKQRIKIIIPNDEYIIKHSSSRGPGGQNVNKRATKSELYFFVFKSKTLSPEQQKRLINNYPYPHEISKNGVIRITSEKERSQKQNDKIVEKKLQKNVNIALCPRTKRVLTKKPRSADEKRLLDKKKISIKKKIRKKVDF